MNISVPFTGNRGADLCIRPQVVSSLIEAWSRGERWSSEWLKERANEIHESTTSQAQIAEAPLAPTNETESSPSDDGNGHEPRPEITADEVRAALLNFQTDMKANTPPRGGPLEITWSGAQIDGAKITGSLNMHHIKFDRSIRFVNCWFELPIVLDEGEFEHVDFSGSCFPWLTADDATFHADLDLISVQCLAVNLRGAHIRGSLHAIGSILALDLFKQWHTFTSKLLTDEFLLEHSDISTAPDELNSVALWADLDQGARKSFEKAFASLEGYLGSCEGEPLLDERKMRDALRSNGRNQAAHNVTQLYEAVALWVRTASSVLAKFDVIFEKSVHAWAVSAPSSALCLQLGDVGKSLCLRADISKNYFTAFGEVDLARARFGSGIDCRECNIIRPNGRAISGKCLHVADDVSLAADFFALGEVRLIAATIDGSLFCSGSTLINCGGDALDLTDAQIGGSCRFGTESRENSDQPFDEIYGTLRLYRAKIAGALEIESNVHVTALSLSLAHATVFDISPLSFPERGKLRLDGFTYDRLGMSSLGAYYGLKLLSRQPLNATTWNIVPQPFLQLAGVLSRTGHNGEARKVYCSLATRKLFWHDSWRWMLSPLLWALWIGLVLLVIIGSRILWPPTRFVLLRVYRKGRSIECMRRELRSILPQFANKAGGAKFGFSAIPIFGVIYWPLRFVLWITAGHGYRPFLAVIWLLGVWLSGVVVFNGAYQRGLMTSAPEIAANVGNKSAADAMLAKSVPFDPFVYSAEVALPIVDLGQRHRWVPKPNSNNQHRSASDVRAPVFARRAYRIVERNEAISERVPAKDALKKWFVASLDNGLAQDWYWTEILLGWALTTIAVAGYAGLVRPPD